MSTVPSLSVSGVEGMSGQVPGNNITPDVLMGIDPQVLVDVLEKQLVGQAKRRIEELTADQDGGCGAENLESAIADLSGLTTSFTAQRQAMKNIC